jgi:2-keto-4-pentenoate hydratase
MLDPARAQEAADLIWKHWQAGTAMPALPDGLRPETRDQGYKVQAGLERFTAQPPYGWKIAATSVAGQKHIGVDGPLAGRILAERVQAPCATVSLAGNRMLVAELEFAFRFARDLPPRADPYDRAEVLDAVATLHPAVEVPDSRFERFETAGAAQLIAEAACARDFVLGAPTTADWRAIDLAAHQVLGTMPRTGEHPGVGSNVLGDPRVALTWLVNELSGQGIALGAGQVVTTGTCVVPIPIRPGDRLHGDFGVLGTIEVAFGG